MRTILMLTLINLCATCVYAQINEGIPPPAEMRSSIFVPNISDYDTNRDDRVIIPSDPLIPQTEKEPCLHDIFDYPSPNACEYK